MSGVTQNIPRRPVIVTQPSSGRDPLPASAVLQRLLQDAARALGTFAALGGDPELAAQIPQGCYAVASRTAYILATDLFTETHDHGSIPLLNVHRF
jgi:hypothetical protein